MPSYSMWRFCAEIKAPPEALDWLEKKLPVSSNEDDDDGEHEQACDDWHEWKGEYERVDAELVRVWTELEQDGDPSALADLVAEMQRLFNISDPCYITWAVVDDHDRPVSDHYRGGAAVCLKGEVTEIDTLDWAVNLVKKLQGAETESQSDDHSTPP